jgi:hypothetical protein
VKGSWLHKPRSHQLANGPKVEAKTQLPGEVSEVRRSLVENSWEQRTQGTGKKRTLQRQPRPKQEFGDGPGM